MNEIEVVVLDGDQWIPLRITSFKWMLTNEGTKFEIEGYEDKWDEQSIEPAA